MPPTPLPRHRVPPGLLMVVTRDEMLELANWNTDAPTRRDPARWWHHAVLQWRFNEATREAFADGGPTMSDALAWHFPPARAARQGPDDGKCHHECGPVAGCWRVATCAPLSGYAEVWPLADRIAHERPGGSL